MIRISGFLRQDDLVDVIEIFLFTKEMVIIRLMLIYRNGADWNDADHRYLSKL